MTAVEERLSALEAKVETLEQDNAQLRAVLRAAGQLLGDRELLLAPGDR